MEGLVFRQTLLAIGAFAITYPSVAADLGFREPTPQHPATESSSDPNSRRFKS
ncbi:MAG: hypothetical protein JWO52_4145 [Gammaproteobacteria bacterium]|nr:hypothetical protein [Gammaproteobacteria bacterium]